MHKERMIKIKTVLVRRDLFTEKYSNLSNGAFKLYIWLLELEYRYANNESDYFIRTNKQLAQDTNMSLSRINKSKRELVRCGLIEHWIDHVSHYRIKKPLGTALPKGQNRNN